MKHLESYFPAKATEKLKIGFFLARLGPSVCLGSERARTMERSAARERSNRIFDYGNSATSRIQHHIETSPNPLREGYQAENPWLRYFPHFEISRGFTCPVPGVLEVAVRSRNAFFSDGPFRACRSVHLMQAFSRPTFLTSVTDIQV